MNDPGSAARTKDAHAPSRSDADARARRRTLLVIALYALLSVVVAPVFPHFQSPNELTRWAFAASVVEHGTPEVSSALPLLSPGFEDLSVAGGRTFSNKAPGAAVLGLPGYVAARVISGPASPASMRVGITAMRLLASTLPAVLLALAFAWAAVRLGGEVTRVPFAVGLLLFGTPFGAYGLLLFSHVLVASALFGAWIALFVPGSPRAMRWREPLAGALIGLAVLSEYPAAVPGLVLVLCAAARRSVPRLSRVVLGGAPFAVALAAYDAACFGSPFALSSGHEKYAAFVELAGGGVFGVGKPSPVALWGLLCGLSKGLLVFSPALLLGLRAYAVAARALPRDAVLALVLAPMAVVVLFSGYPNWHGGWTVGARYLVAALPFVVFPLVFRRGGSLEALLSGASILAVSLTALVFPFAPGEFALPWGTLAGPLLAHGLAAPNVLHLVARPLGAALPFAVVVAALTTTLERRRLAWGAAGAALALGAGLLLHAREPVVLSVERAYIEDVYFERDGEVERAVARFPGLKLPRGLMERRALERTLGPGPWRF